MMAREVKEANLVGSTISTYPVAEGGRDGNLVTERKFPSPPASSPLEYSPHSPENGAAVRRRTRFPLLPGHFPAAAILFRGFLDFRSILEINGRRGPDTRKGRNRLRLPQVGRACFVVCLGLASLALRFAVVVALRFAVVVRSVAVRRHTRFRVEGGYFPAAAIRLARFLDFSSTFRAIGRREFDAGSQELSFLDFPSNSRIIGRRRFDAKSQGTSFALWRPPKSTRQR